MIKKFLLLALMLLPVYAIAQESQKVAYFNYTEVVQVMPEVAQMNDSLKKQGEVFESEMKVLQEELNSKYTAFLEQQDTLAESIKTRRQREIMDLQERAQTFQEQAVQSQQQLQQTLSIPIQEKIRKAVQDVGTENHYAYILDASVLLYVSPQSTDATPLVKAKLGLK